MSSIRTYDVEVPGIRGGVQRVRAKSYFGAYCQIHGKNSLATLIDDPPEARRAREREYPTSRFYVMKDMKVIRVDRVS